MGTDGAGLTTWLGKVGSRGCGIKTAVTESCVSDPVEAVVRKRSVSTAPQGYTASGLVGINPRPEDPPAVVAPGKFATVNGTSILNSASPFTAGSVQMPEPEELSLLATTPAVYAAMP